jgi:hypothetical protein
VIALDGVGPTPARIVTALTTVLADLQPPDPVPLAFGWSWGADDELPTLWIQETTDDSITGFSFPHSEHETLLERFAEQLQDGLSEGSGAWAEPRPRCPGHPHPASVAARRGTAWWRCPADGRWLARVGSFHGRGVTATGAERDLGLGCPGGGRARRADGGEP